MRLTRTRFPAKLAPQARKRTAPPPPIAVQPKPKEAKGIENGLFFQMSWSHDDFLQI
jgi:hypothetical protein